MAISVQNHHVEQYKGNVIHLAQQGISRFRDTVTVETTNGLIHNFERLGATSAVAKTARYPATPNVEVPHDRRQVVLAEYHWASMIDRGDDVYTLVDIEGNYTRNAAMAMARQWDDLIIAAMSADATSKTPSGTAGEYTTAAVALPGGNTIANSIGGDTTMNIGKLLAVKEALLAGEIDEYNDEMFIAVDSKQLHELLNTTQIQSADYNSVKALVNGEIDTFLGLKFIRSERLELRTADRVALVWCKSGVGLAVGEEIMVRASERDDLSYGHQVYMEFIAQATRIEEEKVFEILTVA